VGAKCSDTSPVERYHLRSFSCQPLRNPIGELFLTEDRLMYVSAGTKFYGLVKKVGDVSIVTRFIMFQEMPVFPLESHYLIGEERTETSGVPFLAATHKSIANSIPLAKVDWLSVIFGYIRAVCLAIVVVGLGGAAISGTIYLSVLAGTITPGRPIEGGWQIVQVMVVLFIIATVTGQATYMVPAIKPRDRHIRQSCGELLGLCIDPALVVPAVALRLEQGLLDSSDQSLSRDPMDDRSANIRQLVLLRCQISRASSQELEIATDQLLLRLATIATK
jgi:hypothetical protein